MRRRPVAAMFGALVLLPACGGTTNGASSGTAVVTTTLERAATASTSRATTAPAASARDPERGESARSFGLHRDLGHTPSLQLNLTHPRWWLVAVLAAGDTTVVVDTNDADESLVTSFDSRSERWTATIPDTTATAAVVSGDVILISTHDELLGLSVRDGSTLFRRPLDRPYHLARFGDRVYLMDDGDTAWTVAVLDAATNEPGDEISVPAGERFTVTNHGLLVWDAQHAGLLALESMTTQRWAGGAASEQDAVAPTVAGSTFIRAEGTTIAGIDHQGQVVWSAPTDVGTVTTLWSPDPGHVLVAGTDGFALLRVDGGSVRTTATAVVRGAVETSAVVEGVPYAAWCASDSCHLLRITGDELVDVATLPVPETDRRSVDLVDRALYIDTKTTVSDTGQPKERVSLTAYSLDDGSKLWQLDSETMEDLTASWELSDGLIALVYGVPPPYGMSIYR